MPNDAVGRPLKVGDKVLIPFNVREVSHDGLLLHPELEKKEDGPFVHVEAEFTYRFNPGDELYTGIPVDDGDNDQDDGNPTGASDPPPVPPGSGG